MNSAGKDPFFLAAAQPTDLHERHDTMQVHHPSAGVDAGLAHAAGATGRGDASRPSHPLGAARGGRIARPAPRACIGDDRTSF